MARDIPRFISVDDHVVEPPHLFQKWLPKKCADDPRSPRVERRGIGKMEYKGGTTYEIEWDDSQPKSDTWFYEELVAPHKRHVASVGFPRDEMTLSPITYDEMRPGCYEPKARLEDMDVDHVEASLCFPTFPRFCGQTFAEAKDKDLALACVHAYNDWMVEEWCGDSGGRLIPLCLVPAVGRRARGRGGAPQRGARRAPRSRSPRSRRSSACPRCTPATGSRSSRPAPRPRRSCACTSVRRRRCRPRRPTRRPRSRPRSASATRCRR